VHAREVGDRVLLRDFHLLADARDLALHDRGEDADAEMEARAGIAEARGLRDRSRNNEGPCEPGPPGSGISPCPQLLDADDQPWRRPDPADRPAPPEMKPLWVPPLAPTAQSRRP
jgi:hypothetical protein